MRNTDVGYFQLNSSSYNESLHMSRLLTLTLLTACLLTACGYKGDLYLPKEKGKAKFGPVQTGLSIEPIDQRKLPEND